MFGLIDFITHNVFVICLTYAFAILFPIPWLNSWIIAQWAKLGTWFHSYLSRFNPLK